MEPRMELGKVDNNGFKAMLGLESYVQGTGLDKKVLELIKIRASQLNSCAYCLDMHTKVARKNGETEQRIYALNAWRETPFYTEQERAALALTECVTLIAEKNVPDDVYENAKRLFGEEKLAALIMAIVTINAWNRIGITTRSVPGTFEA